MKSICAAAALSLLIPFFVVKSAAAAESSPRPVVTLSPSADNAGAIQAAWLAGKDVLLEPGVYTIDRVIRRPAHAALRGVNRQAVILMPTSKEDVIQGSGLLPDQYRNKGSQNDGGGFSDLTFDATDFPGTIFYHENVAEPGLVFRNLRVIAGLCAQYNSVGATWTNIELIHASMVSYSDNVSFRNLSFFGRPALEITNEFLIGGNNVTLEQSLWRSTQRGVVIRQGMDKALFKDLDFEDVCAGPENSNEVILEESSGPITNSTFDTIQIHNCRGRPLALDFGGATGNTFIRFDIDGGEGVSIGFKPEMGQNVTRNHFTQFEMRHVVHFAFNGAWDNVLDNCAIVDICPSWTNQFNFDQRYYRRQVVFIGGDRNKIDYPNSVRVIGLPEGWTIGAGAQ
jgi:hypothetical protein